MQAPWIARSPSAFYRAKYTMGAQIIDSLIRSRSGHFVRDNDLSDASDRKQSLGGTIGQWAEEAGAGVDWYAVQGCECPAPPLEYKRCPFAAFGVRWLRTCAITDPQNGPGSAVACDYPASGLSFVLASKVKWKVAPWPGSDSIQIRPPCASTSLRHTSKPSPAPFV